eukprot:g6700.t1
MYFFVFLILLSVEFIVGGSLVDEWNEEANGTYILSKDVTISDTVTVDHGDILRITGIVSMDGKRPAIDGGGNLDTWSHRVFLVKTSGTKLTLTNVTIRNGYGLEYQDGGGLYIQDGTVHLVSCIISSNTAGTYGNGGGLIIAGGQVKLVNCTIFNNTAQMQGAKQGGGGIFVNSGDVVIIDTYFADNTALNGHGNDIFMIPAIIIINTTFSSSNSISGTPYQCTPNICQKSIASYSNYGIDCKNNPNKQQGIQCFPCHPGKYLAEHSPYPSCLPCLAGTATNKYGSASCDACAPGQFQPRNTNATSCTLCDAGKYSNNGIACIDVPPGNYPSNCTDPRKKKGCHSFEACPIGTFNDGSITYSENSACNTCAPGKTTSVIGSVQCTNCTKGRAGIDGECESCAGLLHTDMEGQTKCTPCLSKQVPDSNNIECVNANEEGNGPTITSVEAIDEILFLKWTLPTTNKTVEHIVIVPINVDTGKEDDNILVVNDSTKTSSFLAPTKPIINQVYNLQAHIQYADKTISETTTKIIKWKTTNDCNTDEFYLDASGKKMTSWKCQICPVGASCVGAVTKSNIYTKFGYWQYNKTKYYPCLRVQACLGAKNNAIKRYEDVNIKGRNVASCADGYKNHSRLCASCDINHARGSSVGQCVKCSSELNTVIFLAGGLVATIGTLVLVKITVFKERKVNFSDGVKKIALSYLQTVLLARNMDVPWNQTFHQLFAAQDVITSVSKAFFSLDCVLSTTSTWYVFVLRSICTLLLPLLMVPLTYTCMKFVRGNKDEIISAIVLLWYLMFPSFIQSFAKLISCTEMIGKERYLKVDPEIVCWKGQHLLVFCTAGIITLIYIFGLPGYGLYILHKTNRELPSTRLKYGMLYDGYNDEYYYWEITVIMRKVAIIAIGTFVVESQQIFCVLSVLALLIFLTSYYQPFLSKKLLHLELGSLLLAYFTFWIGGLLQTDATCADESGFWCECAAYFVGICNLFGIVGLAYVFAKAKWREKADVIMGMIREKFGSSCLFRSENDGDGDRKWESNPLERTEEEKLKQIEM